MNQLEYCTFETSLGWCGIAWSGPADSPNVARLHLPEATREMTQARIAASAGGKQVDAPPKRIAELIERVRKHLAGEIQDFRDVPVELDGLGEFERRIYQAAREIPPGQTRTYGELAKILNQPEGARAVGQAMGRNPVPVIIPCHRVVAAAGRPGGFSAPGGRDTKAKLLAIEGAMDASTTWREVAQRPLFKRD